MAVSLDPKADWTTSAEHAISALAIGYRRTGATFTADDLHEITGKPDNSHWTGQAFTSAQRRGEIVKTGAYVPSLRRTRKGSILAVWRAAQ